MLELLEHGALPLLMSYVDGYMCFVEGKSQYLYEVLTAQWFNTTREGDLKGDTAIKCARFLFKLIYKSMVLKLEQSGDLGMRARRSPAYRGSEAAKRCCADQKLTSKSRGKRFSNSFCENLRGLSVVLMWEMQQRSSTALTIGKDLAKDMANFFLDLFSIMDRGVVFKMVHL